MALNPIVIEKGLRADSARKMAEFWSAKSINPGISAAALNIISTAAYEKMGWLGAMPTVQEWLGEMVSKSLEDYEYTIRNKDWCSAISINQNDLDDDQTGTIQLAPEMLVRRIMNHAEGLIFNLLTTGTTGLAYDGVAFFSDVSGARTFDNLLAGTGVTLEALGTDLNTAMIAMSRFTDNNRVPLNTQANMIVCPRALENNFRRLVQSAGDPNVTGGNTFNPYNGRFIVIGDSRLDAVDANDWYLLATNEVVKPFITSSRQTAEVMWEKTPLTKTWTLSANYRGNAGYGLPHLAVKTTNT